MTQHEHERAPGDEWRKLGDEVEGIVLDEQRHIGGRHRGSGW
jgi:hypothetical protein